MNVPAPLYRDPIYDGPADPMVIRKESDGILTCDRNAEIDCDWRVNG